MPINQARLLTKLQAILDKNVDDIIAKQVYLPFVGNSYSRQGLIDWLAARSDLLELAKTATDAQIQTRINNYYNSLNAEDKAIADKIISGDEYNIDMASNRIAYEKLVAIVLSKYITD